MSAIKDKTKAKAKAKVKARRVNKQLTLVPGKFYRARNGTIWCCYRLDAVARCIEVETSRVEYFYLDGRYDHADKRECGLISECEYGRE